MSRHIVIGGDTAGLFSCFAALRQKAKRPKNTLYSMEAGLDGFWLGRMLSKEAWMESHIVEVASIAMPRRHRRAKADRIDGETLIRACSMAKPLSPEEDDNRPIGRERKTLIAERVFHVNRIKGLLFTQGIRDYQPVNRDRRERLDELQIGDGRPLSKHLKAEIYRELDRLLLTQIKAVEAERDALIVRETSETPRRVDGGWCEGFAVDEAMQKVQHLGFRGNAALQRHVHGREHSLLVVLENERQDIDHLAVATRLR